MAYEINFNDQPGEHWLAGLRRLGPTPEVRGKSCVAYVVAAARRRREAAREIDELYDDGAYRPGGDA